MNSFGLIIVILVLLAIAWLSGRTYSNINAKDSKAGPLLDLRDKVAVAAAIEHAKNMECLVARYLDQTGCSPTEITLVAKTTVNGMEFSIKRKDETEVSNEPDPSRRNPDYIRR
jgi:hypothetical protein